MLQYVLFCPVYMPFDIILIRKCDSFYCRFCHLLAKLQHKMLLLNAVGLFVSTAFCCPATSFLFVRSVYNISFPVFLTNLINNAHDVCVA